MFCASDSARIFACRLCVGILLLSMNRSGGGQEPVPKPAGENKIETTTPTVPVKVDLSTFPQGWTFYSAMKDVVIADTWTVVKEGEGENAEEILKCLGTPNGYLRSNKIYKNFELSLEWRFPTDPNGNSGILVHTETENKIWPNSIQVQLHGPTTGSIFPLGEAMSANNLQIRDQKLAPNQWHRCTVKSLDGRISVSINGMHLGEITGCSSEGGSISLQSEGSEVHFRRITIKELPTQATTGPTVSKTPSSEES
jgi:3-keto-disaccharide hydrolase